jgi:xanthine dehydrogenase accessory factor
MNLFKSMVKQLEANRPFVLATIIARSGSAPRVAGTRMIVHADGTIDGTIGGGILEARVRALAGDIFQHGRALTKKFSLSSVDAGDVGMICGGQVQVLLQFMEPSQRFHLELFREVVATLDNRKRAWLVAEIPAEEESTIPPVLSLYKIDGSSTGSIDLEPLREIIAMAGADQPELVCREGRLYLVEPLCHEGTVFIFGAGHISRKLAPLTKLVGFRTVILDDRDNFANRERFPEADQIVVPPGFESAIRGLDIDEDSYLVLVTRGHLYDRVLLGEALKTKAGYIGMIGSRRKRDAIYAALTKEGFTLSDFERVNSPIGLDIGAETPEEIAVSVVAELVQARARKNG